MTSTQHIEFVCHSTGETDSSHRYAGTRRPPGRARIHMKGHGKSPGRTGSRLLWSIICFKIASSGRHVAQLIECLPDLHEASVESDSQHLRNVHQYGGMCVCVCVFALFGNIISYSLNLSFNNFPNIFWLMSPFPLSHLFPELCVSLLPTSPFPRSCLLFCFITSWV